MSAWLIAACGAAYLWVAINMLKQDPWMSLVYCGYACANCGLVMKALGH